MSVREAIQALHGNIKQDIIGQEDIIEALLIGLLSDGNILVTGLPGLAKTRAIKALSKYVEGDFKRIQFTPDLTAADITGREVYYGAGDHAKGTFKFEKGPVFANIVLADEINRAPARVQNALLEAMEERQVTVAAVPHKMPDLFMVMATQNPVHQEGTFPLPEAQMDRFLINISVEYPDEDAEQEIVRLVRGEQNAKAVKKAGQAPPDITPQETIFSAREEINAVQVPAHIERYMVDLIFATRYPDRYTYELKSYLALGASPRASLAIDKCARAHSWLKGRGEVTLEDVRAMIKPVLRHRLTLSDRSREHKVHPDELIDDILELVRAPDPA